MSNKKKIFMCLIFSIIIFCVTFFTKKDINGTFLSLGDAFIMMAACFLPTGWAMLAALIGNGVASFLIGGWQALAAITLFRVLAACWFMDDEKKLITSRTAIGAVMSFVLFSVGPLLLDMLISEGTNLSLTLLGTAALGAAFNMVLFFAIALFFDIFKVKTKIQK